MLSSPLYSWLLSDDDNDALPLRFSYQYIFDYISLISDSNL